MKQVFAAVLLLSCLYVLGVPSGYAAMLQISSSNHDQVGFGETITVEDAHPAKDVVCFFCTVHLRGDLSGDLVTFFSDVDVSDSRSIQRDAVMFGGQLSMANGSTIGRDLVVFGSDLHQAANSSVGGDHVVFAGTGWLLALLIPLLIPISVIWLIVWLVFRPRYRFPAYPGGRRF